MVSERFEILNEKEKSLHGVVETNHPRKKQPIVIVMNGFLDTCDSGAKNAITKHLLETGHVVVRFDYTYGFGEGEGDISMFTLTRQVEDTERVIDHVTRRGYADPDRVFLFSHCFGGMAAILLAAFDERIKGLIAISTPYWFEDTSVTRLDDKDLSRMKLKRYFHLHSESLGREIRVDYTFFEDGLKKDMARAVRNLRQPLLLIHGTNDPSIPVENAQEIYDRAPGEKQLELIEGMGHDVDTRNAKKLFPFVDAFLKKHAK
jgi:pimeloyl-ACP methyl ester carboxylesterase